MSIHSLLVGIGKGMNAIESFHKLNYPVFYQTAFSHFLFSFFLIFSMDYLLLILCSPLNHLVSLIFRITNVHGNCDSVNAAVTPARVAWPGSSEIEPRPITRRHFKSGDDKRSSSHFLQRISSGVDTDEGFTNRQM